MCHSFSNEYKNLHNGTHKDEAGTNNLDESWMHRNNLDGIYRQILYWIAIY